LDSIPQLISGKLPGTRADAAFSRRHQNKVLILLKATKQIDHEGGERIKAGSEAYPNVGQLDPPRSSGRNPGEPVLQSISVKPERGTYRKGQEQPLEVAALYSDGSKRIVTHLCEFQSPRKDSSMSAKRASSRSVAARAMAW